MLQLGIDVHQKSSVFNVFAPGPDGGSLSLGEGSPAGRMLRCGWECANAEVRLGFVS
jgi:hypothetical protein